MKSNVLKPKSIAIKIRKIKICQIFTNFVVLVAEYLISDTSFSKEV